MGASYSPRPSPSKRGHLVNEYRPATARRTRGLVAHLQERLQRWSSPIALLPSWLPRQEQRPIQPRPQKASAPFQRVVAASIGKSANRRGVKGLRGGIIRGRKP